MSEIQNQTIYTIERDESNYLFASILTPTASRPSTMSGWETVEELVNAIKEQYGQEITRLPLSKFQTEAELRRVHTPEMLARLKDSWAGDLRDQFVYGSILRPMTGIRIDSVIYLPGCGAKYDGHWTIHTYVVSPTPLEKTITGHYDLVFLSGPVKQ